MRRPKPEPRPEQHRRRREVSIEEVQENYLSVDEIREEERLVLVTKDAELKKKIATAREERHYQIEHSEVVKMIELQEKLEHHYETQLHDANEMIHNYVNKLDSKVLDRIVFIQESNSAQAMGCVGMLNALRKRARELEKIISN